MGHRINEWIQRLIVLGAVIATLPLSHLGLSVLKTLAIVLPIASVLMLSSILLDPGPTANLWKGSRICFASASPTRNRTKVLGVIRPIYTHNLVASEMAIFRQLTDSFRIAEQPRNASGPYLG
jgi:hypothetical protein